MEGKLHIPSDKEYGFVPDIKPRNAVAFTHDVLDRVYAKIGRAMKVDDSRLGGVVHGGEYLLSNAENKSRRSALDTFIGNKNVTRKVDGNGNVFITVNNPK